MVPEIIDQVCCGIETKAVLTFNMNVKSTIDTPREIAIVRAFFLFVVVDSPPPAIELPTISGSNGSVHGARIVRTPAMNERRSKIMVGIIAKNIDSEVI